MVDFKVIRRQNPVDPNAPPKYYAQVVKSGTVDIEKISRDITKMTTVTPVDTVAVLKALTILLPDYLADGKTVDLTGFGRLSLSARSTGEEDENDVTASNIFSPRLLFRPAQIIKDALKVLKFGKKSNS